MVCVSQTVRPSNTVNRHKLTDRNNIHFSGNYHSRTSMLDYSIIGIAETCGQRTSVSMVSSNPVFMICNNTRAEISETCADSITRTAGCIRMLSNQSLSLDTRAKESCLRSIHLTCMLDLIPDKCTVALLTYDDFTEKRTTLPLLAEIFSCEQVSAYSYPEPHPA
jgi:hypothetical protein